VVPPGAVECVGVAGDLLHELKRLRRAHLVDGAANGAATNISPNDTM
jgi:hypothetical protein